jgi:arylsulfatase A-like enzyme
MLAYADARIGDLLAVLKASPRWNNTLVIITSDNGGSVPLGGSNTPFSGSKGTWLEGGVHLPGIIGGGILPANRRGSVYSRLAHVTDMYSTVLALASKGTYTKAADVDGVNLWPSIGKARAKTGSFQCSCLAYSF